MRRDHVIGGPLPPDWMHGKGTNLAYAREAWLRSNNEHLYWHEQVRLAKAAVSRARAPSVPGYAMGEARKRLAAAEQGLAEYERRGK